MEFDWRKTTHTHTVRDWTNPTRTRHIHIPTVVTNPPNSAYAWEFIESEPPTDVKYTSFSNRRHASRAWMKKSYQIEWRDDIWVDRIKQNTSLRFSRVLRRNENVSITIEIDLITVENGRKTWKPFIHVNRLCACVCVCCVFLCVLYARLPIDVSCTQCTQWCKQ